MAKRFVVPFASTGDKSVTPDATDPAGAISYSQGWGSQYQLADTDPSYRPVGRQEMNGVLFDVTGAIAEIQTLGYPEWVAVAGLVTPYAINATVRHNNVNWRNTIANNSAEPGAVGVTTWVDADAAPPLHGQQRYTASGSYTVPVGVTTIYASACAPGGGGGGGAGSNSGVPTSGAGGGGGGAGQSIQRVPYAVTPGQVITITMGAPGTGGAGGYGSSVGNPGTDGGTVVIGSLVTLTGGLKGGGGLNNGAGGAGGAGFPWGGAGGDCTNNQSTGQGGMGGSTPFGGGGGNGRAGVAGGTAGQLAGGFGGGGGGGGGSYSTTGAGGTGGAGAPAFVVIEH